MFLTSMIARKHKKSCRKMLDLDRDPES